MQSPSPGSPDQTKDAHAGDRRAHTPPPVLNSPVLNSPVLKTDAAAGRPIAVLVGLILALVAPLKLCAKAAKGGVRIADDAARQVHASSQHPIGFMMKGAVRVPVYLSRDRDPGTSEGR